MNWEHVYEYLKRNNGKVNEDFTDTFMNLKPSIIQDGIEEYKIMQGRNVDIYSPIDWGVN